VVKEMTMSEATIETPAKPRRQRKAKPGTFRIIFETGKDRYAVIPLQPDPDVATHAVRLRKPDGTTYDLRVDTESGRPVCECPGFVQHGLCKSGQGCRHVRMLVAAKMFPAFGAGEKR
jgi:hypothetical protein